MTVLPTTMRSSFLPGRTKLVTTRSVRRMPDEACELIVDENLCGLADRRFERYLPERGVNRRYLLRSADLAEMALSAAGASEPLTEV